VCARARNALRSEWLALIAACLRNTYVLKWQKNRVIFRNTSDSSWCYRLTLTVTQQAHPVAAEGSSSTTFRCHAFLLYILAARKRCVRCKQTFQMLPFFLLLSFAEAKTATQVIVVQSASASTHLVDEKVARRCIVMPSPAILTTRE